MERLLILLILAISFSNSYLSATTTVEVYPIFDSQEHKLPYNFRSVIQRSCVNVNFKGLDQLKISGSAQFSENTFYAMLQTLAVPPNQLTIIDLREESHGFINGMAVSWTDGNNFANKNKTKMEIIADEIGRLNESLQEQDIHVIDHLGKPNKITIDRTQTEQELVESFGLTYIRLPITDHKHPSDEIIDEFIAIIHKLSSDDWIHVHCRAGKGRTTTLISMYDMMKNAHQVSLEDILGRQWLIGGVDLTHIQKKNSERSQNAIEKLDFLKAFYRYCQEVADFQMSWSEWIALKPHV